MIIHRITGLLLLFSVATGIASAQDVDTVAFPGAEGAGKFTKGGRPLAERGRGGSTILINVHSDAPWRSESHRSGRRSCQIPGS